MILHVLKHNDLGSKLPAALDREHLTVDEVVADVGIFAHDLRGEDMRFGRGVAELEAAGIRCHTRVEAHGDLPGERYAHRAVYLIKHLAGSRSIALEQKTAGIPEIGAVMGSSAQNVGVKLFRIKEMLKNL